MKFYFNSFFFQIVNGTKCHLNQDICICSCCLSPLSVLTLTECPNPIPAIGWHTARDTITTTSLLYCEECRCILRVHGSEICKPVVVSCRLAIKGHCSIVQKRYNWHPHFLIIHYFCIHGKYWNRFPIDTQGLVY